MPGLVVWGGKPLQIPGQIMLTLAQNGPQLFQQFCGRDKLLRLTGF
jgi:hypothetical protein